MIDYDSPDFWSDLFEVLLKGTLETLYMTGIATVITILVGLPLGILLVGTEKGAFLERSFGPVWVARTINRVVGFVVNVGRSVPFIILMIALIPLTRLIVGTFVGTTAAIVPLTIIAIPFFARMVEIAVNDVAPGLYETADSLGATKGLLIRRVLLTEGLPAILLGVSTTITSIINFSAMVGVVGGGGLGNVAVTYGFQRYSWIHIVFVVVILFAIVQIVQIVLTRIATRVSHRSSTAVLPKDAELTINPAQGVAT
ncbi:ABC transporter permease [Herbiconiux sp. CPCC 203407]|uniref:ABC transporter permease n=1 Tax=Herbiconiux oxytropis TaxID=2970915 RepID=A0AA41XII4_9MICO|nr:methionine ABC transporter permease [Herbiconiux oxytropis]MCS5722189.1 ABC transporter permease [Herbiconiux oxytropis]MCS5725771.1 ABC transporter permease [Herbiconiux oxytropis]